MESAELRKKFLSFFKEKEHTIVSSSSLLPSDPSCLFTTAGMQQFKEYYLDKPSSYGNRVASCQKCFRTSDLEEVGDRTHLIFFEMLGNFSFRGSYFKKESTQWALEFLTERLKIPAEKLWFTYFKGEGNIPEDVEAKKALVGLGIKGERIAGCLRKDNFWGPTGKQGPCGPTIEIHIDLKEIPCNKKKDCLPNCDCGRFLEIWNLVFNEFYQDGNGNINPLKEKGVDTGMGLERLAMVLQGKNSVFETDLFWPMILEMEKFRPGIYRQNERICRILVDHIKAAVFLASEGVLPSNIEQGYVLRRILRRVLRLEKLIGLYKDFDLSLARRAIEIYRDVYPELNIRQSEILTIIQKEQEKFEKTLETGLKQFEKLMELKTKNKEEKIIGGEEAFDLYQSYGFPLELTREMAEEKNFLVDDKGFSRAQKKHQEISRAGAEKKFGGIGEKASEQAIKLHTATHLLHAALRGILGKEVRQMGSDITSERLRFDFFYPRKTDKEQLKMVEELVNRKIKEGLEVKKEEMSLDKALKLGALAFAFFSARGGSVEAFSESGKGKYPEKVSVYSIYNPSDSSGAFFSREICAGPHIGNTSELGRFKILKEEGLGGDIRRIRAILENV